MKIDELTIDDIVKNPVWRYSNEGSFDYVIADESRLPTMDTHEKLIGCRVHLANGDELWGLLGNISASSKLYNSQFITIALLRDGKWMNLLRYHDVGFTSDNRESFSSKFGLTPKELFPIRYDLRDLVQGNPEALCGEIPAEPERLSRKELFELALEH